MHLENLHRKREEKRGKEKRKKEGGGGKKRKKGKKRSHGLHVQITLSTSPVNVFYEPWEMK